MIGDWQPEKEDEQKIPPYVRYVARLGRYVFPPGQHIIPNLFASYSSLGGGPREKGQFDSLSDKGIFDEDGQIDPENQAVVQFLQQYQPPQASIVQPNFPGDTLPPADTAANPVVPETLNFTGIFGPHLDVLDQVPEKVLNQKFDPDEQIPIDQEIKAMPWHIRSDAVFTVVIDTGMVPAHERFLDNTGETRVVASWQQFSLNETTDLTLPFGREVMRSEIQADVERIQNGVFSEEQALRHRGLIGSGEDISVGMMRHSSHGMHSADLAAGYGPIEDRPETGAQPIFLINLPPRRAIGRTGAFLPYFVVSALSRALHWIDTLMLGASSAGDDTPWSIFVNLSFGQQAGPKDGFEILEGAIAQLIEARAVRQLPAPTIVMPIGNNNLERSHVEFCLPGQQESDVVVHVQPEDQTASMIEFWTEKLTDADWPLDIGISAPGITLELATPHQPDQPHYADLKVGDDRVGMVFVQRHERGAKYRFQYVFIVNPTQFPGDIPQNENIALAPAGAWRIRLKNKRDDPIQITGDIEVDQALRSDNLTVRRAYFADPKFTDLTDATGRPFDHGDIRQSDFDRLTEQVKQAGNQNSLANSNHVTVISGHRRSDGQPVPYSAVMKGKDQCDTVRMIDYSFPCEDAPAHFGTMAAGIGSCSTSLRGGTSFAAALATRHLVENRMGRTMMPINTEAKYKKNDDKKLKKRTKVPEAKIGPQGRKDRKARKPVDRLDSGFDPSVLP
ncbi:S8/S53 family peptidase [Thalassococcus lentus]|uniref:Peptidase S8/S53 domain-containing protein n=1 Tax=Thalassococcus lentus TaxID=1210524 RepID=A0ABT4XUM6_9RHOB|nr:hypothetical protein [Thalassococcus lentus]MDA7425642.1 hypothetical protein [Thalassococcus lentus]